LPARRITSADRPGAVPTATTERRSAAWSACAALLVGIAMTLAPAVASGAACPSLDDSYTGNCGPTFAVPNWTDAGGWDDPSKYATIQLADVNGDGRDELFGRNDQGVEIFWFDTTLGQWRPQVGANGLPQALTDFASLPPWQEGDATNPKNPAYYTTIQAADMDGQPGEEILGRFPDGMRAFKYTPPAGGRSIDGGTWKRVATGGPYRDNDGYGDASLYPTIHAARLTDGRPTVLFARDPTKPNDNGSLLTSFLAGGSWLTGPVRQIEDFSDDNCLQPACTLDLQAVNLSPLQNENGTSGQANDIIGRNRWGVTTWAGSPFVRWWNMDPVSANPPGVFADVESRDCPFSTAGATGPGSGDCLGSSPSYYETLQGADIDGDGSDELLARASDGLRVYDYLPEFGFSPRATLTALAGAASTIPAGEWGSIRTGDIDGDHADEVLFLDGKGLQAWSYDGSAWSQVPVTTQLALVGDPWLSHPEYFSTLRVGDVDGDGRDDVIARGPFGIRTWFFNRRGTAGWERYLPEGYPDFPSRPCPSGVTGPCGQPAAFAKLSDLAHQTGPSGLPVIPLSAATVRDVWASETAPPSLASDLTKLRGDLPTLAGCTGLLPGEPPSYQACTPPQGSVAFTADDWKAVVNQMLAEIAAAQDVLDFFTDLESMRTSLFIAENAELPVIGDELGLQVAADSTAQFNAGQLWSVIFGIAGSLAGIVQPELSAAMWVASEVASAVPAASTTAMSTFQTTYAGVQRQFANMITEIDNSMVVQSRTVRQDAGLLGLVAQLRARGAWEFDTTAMESAANQGFTVWAYRSLMPALYDRYVITGCVSQHSNDYNANIFCTPAPDTLGVFGGGTQDFTAIGQRLTKNSYPCWWDNTAFPPAAFDCAFDRVPAERDRVWGPMSPDCIYQPGKAAWKFDCNLGVDERTSVGQNTWRFKTYHGSFKSDDMLGPDETFAAAAIAARRPANARIRLGRPRSGRRDAVRAHALLRAPISLPRGLRLAGAKVRIGRLLFERSGHGELTRRDGRRAPRTVTLRRTAAGTFAARTAGKPRARVVLRRKARRTLVTLEVDAAAIRAPRACHALRAGVSTRRPRMELESHLVIRDGDTRRRVVLTHGVRCARDGRGNVDRLVPIRQRARKLRAGLKLSLRGPGRVRPGRKVRYVARVTNGRKRSRRVRASLWNVTVGDRVHTKRIRELRRGSSRTVVFTRRIPLATRGRVCETVVATSPGTRAARARECARPRRPAS
jgi:hypothetical protein